MATRLNEARDLTRYVINLLIFLGLLGTFYGLAITVPEVVNTIKSLVPKEGQTGIEVFDNLMAGLEGQLGGMGTAFASSLLGLAGSLVVGLFGVICKPWPKQILYAIRGMAFIFHKHRYFWRY